MLMPISEVARELGMSEATVRRLIKTKRWPSYRLSEKVTKVDLEEVKNHCHVKSTFTEDKTNRG